MYFVTFIVALVFIVVAASLFGRGLVSIYQKNERARGLISSGFMVGLLGVIISAIIFGFFSI
jgi:Na+(H+)/acetate symporter ActP